ncbi:hypothetical protein FALBO_13061 [Fusarium albosuccineum]|uniref:NB-ARC domain-containing protein n=1 Tax=Fusarium albosuccineum TaxID=1237068 RepID=A0A8H4L2T2_9HYPO|nr:hypothetical protein FALBO_13061 [Fusarium albosuccineum]
MNGPTFPGPVQGSNVLTGIHASGNAQQTINFHNPSAPRPRHVIAYERNEDFVPRPDIVASLESLLPMNSDEYHSAALWGLGGSGKTQIALAYAYNRCRNTPCSVFWVHADNEATFSQGYTTIAGVLGLNQEEDGHKPLKSVRHGIESLGRWLLVVDNADDLTLFGAGPATNRRKESFMEYIPKGPNGTVLWTSRDEKISGSLVGSRRGISVAKMTLEESKMLLETWMARPIKQHETEDAECLLRELQWLPLAISQAGAYMRRTDTSISEYLSRLKEEKGHSRVLKETVFDRHRWKDAPNSILETWSISIRRLKEENEISYTILHILAYVDNQNIPWDLLEAAAKFGGKKRPYRAPYNVREAVGRLKDFSFLTEHQTESHEQRFELHKLVQDAARYNLGFRSLREKEKERLALQSAATRSRLKRLLRSITGTHKPVGKDAVKKVVRDQAFFAAAALQIIDNLLNEKERLGYKESWADCERLLAHALRACEWAEMCDSELLAAGLLQRVGNYLDWSGRYRECQLAVEHQLRLTNKVLGQKHYKSIEALWGLGWAYLDQHQFSEAEKLGITAVKLAQEELGERHELTFKCKRLLIVSSQRQGAETLDQARQFMDESNPRIIYCMSDLANIYTDQRELDKARELQSRVCELLRGSLGDANRNTHGALCNLGRLHYMQKRFEVAEKILTELLELQRKSFGEEHPDTAHTLYWGAVIWRCLGQTRKAQDTMEKCLRIRRKVLGADHKDTTDASGCLEAWANEDQARDLRREGRHIDAVNLMQKSLEWWREVWGPNDVSTMLIDETLKAWDLEDRESRGDLTDDKRVIVDKDLPPIPVSSDDDQGDK